MGYDNYFPGAPNLMSQNQMDDMARKIRERRDFNASLPQYRCHKVVRAAQVASVRQGPNGEGWTLSLRAGGTLQDVDVPANFSRQPPQAEGYYVVYEDGYVSYSPAKAFEDGYAPLSKDG